MSAKIDSTERLLNLVIALLGTRRGYSKSHIRSNIAGYQNEQGSQAEAAFDRMFERDKDLLQGLGIPLLIMNEAGSGDEDQARYRIDPAKYRVPQVRLDEDAMAIVALAAQLWAEATLGSAAQSALRKIAATAGTGWFVDEARSSARVRTADPAFGPLWNALRDHHIVRFSYRKAGADHAVERTVQPWALGNKYGQWYLVGLDVDKAEKRSFRLSRFASDVRVDTRRQFAAPADFSITEELAALGTGTPQTAHIAVPVDAAQELRGRPETTVVKDSHWRRDGWEVLAVPYREPELMAEDVAALGDGALALAPAELRDAVVTRLRGARDMQQAVSAVTLGTWRKQAPSPAATRQDTRGRLLRLLSMVPYLWNNQGVTEEEVLKEFGITRQQWAKDMDTLNLAGLPGYFHGDLMDVTNDEGQIFIRDAETLAAPLRLTQEEACTILVALRALLTVAGPAQQGMLGEVIAQLVTVAGEDAWLSNAVALHLVSDDHALRTIADLQDAIVHGRARAMNYLVPLRDERSERIVDPLALFSVDSQWYLRAWCRRSEGLRSFRIDRMSDLRDAGPQLYERAPGGGVEHGVFYDPSSSDTRIRLLVEGAAARQLAPRYNAELFSIPAEGTVPEGWLGMEFAMAQPANVSRLMARLGGRGALVAPAELREKTRQWLTSALAGYGAHHAMGETMAVSSAKGR